jgi:hypothetical protein
MKGEAHKLVDLGSMRVHARCRKYNALDWLERYQAHKDVEKLDAAIRRALKNSSLRARL